VASVAIGIGDGGQVPSPSSNYSHARLARALAGLSAAADAGAALALLPEEFMGAGGPIAGFPNDFVTLALGKAARSLDMYVAYGLRVAGSEGDRQQFHDLGEIGYNTAVVLDRKTGGLVRGTYRKQWPCCVDPAGRVGDDGYPSRSGTTVLDLPGVGRVAMLTCYDANFDESWHEAFAQRADLLLWPSAYGGGLALRAYAQLYHYHIVPAGWGDVRDVTGEVVAGLRRVASDVFVAQIDLDRTLIHTDFNGAVAQLLAEHKGDVEEETHDECARAHSLVGLWVM
jgi:predicted amidohydrolase